jgi:hypothetical protein
MRTKESGYRRDHPRARPSKTNHANDRDHVATIIAARIAVATAPRKATSSSGVRALNGCLITGWVAPIQSRPVSISMIKTIKIIPMTPTPPCPKPYP